MGADQLLKKAFGSATVAMVRRQGKGGKTKGRRSVKRPHGSPRTTSSPQNLGPTAPLVSPSAKATPGATLSRTRTMAAVATQEGRKHTPRLLGTTLGAFQFPGFGVAGEDTAADFKLFTAGGAFVLVNRHRLLLSVHSCMHMQAYSTPFEETLQVTRGTAGRTYGERQPSVSQRHE